MKLWNKFCYYSRNRNIYKVCHFPNFEKMTEDLLKEGYIRDLSSGKQLRETPEEKVRQDYERVLYEDYDYEFGQMGIEVPIQRGEKNSKKNRNERADIVIYRTSDKSKRNQNEDILGIIETKRPTRKEWFSSKGCC